MDGLKAAREVAETMWTWPLALLGKYQCWSCDAIGAMRRCYQCSVPGYCSKQCEERHWHDAGHKLEYEKTCFVALAWALCLTLRKQSGE